MSPQRSLFRRTSNCEESILAEKCLIQRSMFLRTSSTRRRFSFNRDGRPFTEDCLNQRSLGGFLSVIESWMENGNEIKENSPDCTANEFTSTWSSSSSRALLFVQILGVLRLLLLRLYFLLLSWFCYRFRGFFHEAWRSCYGGYRILQGDSWSLRRFQKGLQNRGIYSVLKRELEEWRMKFEDEEWISDGDRRVEQNDWRSLSIWTAMKYI